VRAFLIYKIVRALIILAQDRLRQVERQFRATAAARQFRRSGRRSSASRDRCGYPWALAARHGGQNQCHANTENEHQDQRINDVLPRTVHPRHKINDNIEQTEFRPKKKGERCRRARDAENEGHLGTPIRKSEASAADDYDQPHCC